MDTAYVKSSQDVMPDKGVLLSAFPEYDRVSSTFIFRNYDRGSSTVIFKNYHRSSTTAAIGGALQDGAKTNVSSSQPVSRLEIVLSNCHA